MIYDTAPTRMTSLHLLPTPASSSASALAGWLAFCFAAAVPAAFMSTGGWYAALQKPSWNPPAWVFAPGWNALYITMAVAAWLVWRRGGWQFQRTALGLFLVQWLLSALWTPLFFSMHLIGFAAADILLLWLALAATVILFWRVRTEAGLLLLPYLAWVSFAAMLNFTIWRLNP